MVPHLDKKSDSESSKRREELHKAREERKASGKTYPTNPKGKKTKQ